MNANIQVVVDENEIKQRINEQIDQIVKLQVLFLDMKRLQEITSMQPAFLEDKILSHPQVKIYERRYARKRFWKAEPVLKAIENIVDSW